ncbi:MAG TPA: hypothetical protein VLQ94_06875, partial [Candidatus Binatia bacterium]|nr:hypothetical protein [Candidatus Binatia bacterium]
FRTDSDARDRRKGAACEYPMEYRGFLGLKEKKMWDRKKISHGTPIDGRYLALAGRRVNLRGTSLVSDEEDKRKKMKRAMIVLTVLSVFAVSAFTGMSARQGGGMMSGGWWWGMNSVWLFMAVSVILVVYGVFSIMKRG